MLRNRGGNFWHLEFLALKLSTCKARTKLDTIQAPRGTVLWQIFTQNTKREKRQQTALRKALNAYKRNWRPALRVMGAADK